MNEYEFELIFELRPGEKADTYLEPLFEAGCDDAVVGTGAAGSVGLRFMREAESARHAIESAIKAVMQAIPHAKLESAGPDLLNLSELAFEFGCTKQNMSKYSRGKMVSTKTPFPKPVIRGKASYWHAAEVAHWLKENGGLDISDTMLETLYAIWSLNQANEILHQPNPEMTAIFTDALRSVA